VWETYPYLSSEPCILSTTIPTALGSYWNWDDSLPASTVQFGHSPAMRVCLVLRIRLGRVSPARSSPLELVASSIVNNDLQSVTADTVA
jgi:hypothetical protein